MALKCPVSLSYNLRFVPPTYEYEYVEIWTVLTTGCRFDLFDWQLLYVSTNRPYLTVISILNEKNGELKKLRFSLQLTSVKKLRLTANSVHRLDTVQR